jgi:hypothetical protein
MEFLEKETNSHLKSLCHGTELEAFFTALFAIVSNYNFLGHFEK